MAVVRPKFDCKKYKKTDISSCEFTKGLEQYFKVCSENYSDYLNHYFIREGGVISGFRFTDVRRKS